MLVLEEGWCVGTWGVMVCWYLGNDGVLVLGDGWCVGT